MSNQNCRFEAGQRDDSGSSDPMRSDSAASPPPHEPSEGVKVCGYSERGIFNALLYEIRYAPNALDLLRQLLALVRIPSRGLEIDGLEGVEILVEQSLSDFGDADAILLLHGSDWRCTLFMEGKVKPSQTAGWAIENAWADFLRPRKGKLDSSNLFTQLYHKVRFISALRTGGVRYLKKGVEFPSSSTKQKRMIGRNPVVVRAAQMIEAYSERAFYVAIVPDASDRLDRFFAEDLVKGPGSDVIGWDTDGWGYLSWQDVEAFCREHEMTNTLRVFYFNKGQIY
jgi:hypothetical protein